MFPLRIGLPFCVVVVVGLFLPLPGQSQSTPLPSALRVPAEVLDRIEGNWEVTSTDARTPGKTDVTTISLWKARQLLHNGAPIAPWASFSTASVSQWRWQRVDDSDWSGLDRGALTYAADGSFVLKGYGKKVSTLRPVGGNALSGRWREGEFSGEETWRRLVPRITAVEFGGITTDRVAPAGHPGRLRVLYEAGDSSRGNKRSFTINILGENLGGTHYAWVEGGDIEAYVLTYIRTRKTGESYRQMMDFGGQDPITGRVMEGFVWSKVTPGIKQLHFDNLTIPFQLDVDGMPAPPVAASAVPAPPVVTAPAAATAEKPPPLEELQRPVVRVLPVGTTPDVSPGLTAVVEDQPFEIHVFVPPASLPKLANGRTPDPAKAPPTITVKIVKEDDGETELALRYKGGCLYSTASPITAKSGGGGGLQIGSFDFSTVLGSSRLSGGIGSIDVPEGGKVTVSYQGETASFTVHESYSRLSLAAYRAGFVALKADAAQKLGSDGLSEIEQLALTMPEVSEPVKAFIRSHTLTEGQRVGLERTVRACSHILTLIDGDYYKLVLTKLALAENYAGMLRAGMEDRFENEIGYGNKNENSPSAFGFNYINDREMDAVTRGIAKAREERSLALTRLARDTAVGFYQWTLSLSWAGDATAIAGINPVTGKPLSRAERIVAAVNAASGLVTQAATTAVTRNAMGETVLEIVAGKGSPGKPPAPIAARPSRTGAGAAAAIEESPGFTPVRFDTAPAPRVPANPPGDNTATVRINPPGDNSPTVRINPPADNSSTVRINPVGDNTPTIRTNPAGDNSPTVRPGAAGDNTPTVRTAPRGDNSPTIVTRPNSPGDNSPTVVNRPAPAGDNSPTIITRPNSAPNNSPIVRTNPPGDNTATVRINPARNPAGDNTPTVRTGVAGDNSPTIVTRPNSPGDNSPTVVNRPAPAGDNSPTIITRPNPAVDNSVTVVPRPSSPAAAARPASSGSSTAAPAPVATSGFGASPGRPGVKVSVAPANLPTPIPTTATRAAARRNRPPLPEADRAQRAAETDAMLAATQTETQGKGRIARDRALELLRSGQRMDDETALALRQDLAALGVQDSLRSRVALARRLGVREDDIAAALQEMNHSHSGDLKVAGRDGALRNLESEIAEKRGYVIVAPDAAIPVRGAVVRALTGNTSAVDREFVRLQVESARREGRDWFADLSRQGTMNTHDGFIALANAESIAALRKLAEP